MRVITFMLLFGFVLASDSKDSTKPNPELYSLQRCGYKGKWLCNATTEYCNRNFADQSRDIWGQCQPCRDICMQKEHENECVQNCLEYFINSLHEGHPCGNTNINFITSWWTKERITWVAVVAFLLLIILMLALLPICPLYWKKLVKKCRKSIAQFGEAKPMLPSTEEVSDGAGLRTDALVILISGSAREQNGDSAPNPNTLNGQSAREETTPIPVSTGESPRDTETYSCRP